MTRNRNFRRKGGKKKTVTNSLNQNQKKEVKSLIKSSDKALWQLKHWSPATVSNNPNTTPTIYGMNSAIVQGDGDDNRIGDSIKPQYLEYRLALRVTTAQTAGTPVIFRFMLFRDMLADGALPGGADIFEHSGDALSVYNNIHMLNKPHRFQILEDKLVRCVGTSSMANQVLHRKIDLSKHGLTKYISDSGSDGSLGQGALIYLIMSNQASGTNLGTDFDYRIAYYDV